MSRKGIKSTLVYDGKNFGVKDGACQPWFIAADAYFRSIFGLVTAFGTTKELGKCFGLGGFSVANRNCMPPNCQEEEAGQSDLGDADTVGRRAAALSSAGSFSLSAGSNRAGNDEAYMNM